VGASTRLTTLCAFIACYKDSFISIIIIIIIIIAMNPRFILHYVIFPRLPTGHVYDIPRLSKLLSPASMPLPKMLCNRQFLVV
jgi:hypothetical protein